MPKRNITCDDCGKVLGEVSFPKEQPESVWAKATSGQICTSPCYETRVEENNKRVLEEHKQKKLKEKVEEIGQENTMRELIEKTIKGDK